MTEPYFPTIPGSMDRTYSEHDCWTVASMWYDPEWPVSGDDIALYRAGVYRG